MPKMGESVSEATIICWNKGIGDMVELDETIIEIATDKVDSEVPSTHEGKLIEMLFKADDVVQVGIPFAVLETSGDEDNPKEQISTVDVKHENVEVEPSKIENKDLDIISNNNDNRFYSPLVRSMASQEGIKIEELNTISGTGKDGRVTKSDMLNYLKDRVSSSEEPIKDHIQEKSISSEKVATNEIQNQLIM